MVDMLFVGICGRYAACMWLVCLYVVGICDINMLFVGIYGRYMW